MIFILSSIFRRLGFSSVIHTSIYEDSESNVSKNIEFSGGISNNWPSDLLGTIVYNTLEFFGIYY